MPTTKRELAITALEAAVRLHGHRETSFDSSVLRTADKFLEWLQEKA